MKCHGHARLPEGTGLSFMSWWHSIVCHLVNANETSSFYLSFPPVRNPLDTPMLSLTFLASSSEDATLPRLKNFNSFSGAAAWSVLQYVLFGETKHGTCFFYFVWSPRGPRWHLSRHKLLHFTSHVATFYWTSYLTNYLPCCFIWHLIKHKFWHSNCDILPKTFSDILSDIYINNKRYHNMIKHNLIFLSDTRKII